MINPILLQKQLNNNVNDIEEFHKDLQNWGDEMKRKENSRKESDSVIKKVKSQKAPNNKTKKGPTDYAKWEKFDAELECDLLEDDIKDDSELTDEFEESKHDEALVHKEKGNSYVKSKEWNKAIECYTKAIKCYSYDAVFYANRALCYIKLNKFDNAEADCTLSLKLDKTYVKALQRRAVAREELGELELAANDLETVLGYEPKNKESLSALDNIRKKMGEKTKKAMIDMQRPVSKFTASRNKVEHQPARAPEIGESASVWQNQEDNVTLIKTINKPPHLRSTKPLKRVEIVDHCELPDNKQNVDPVKKHVIEHVQLKSTENEAPAKISAFKMKREETMNKKNDQLSSVGWPTPTANCNVIKCEDMQVCEKKLPSEDNLKDVKNIENLTKQDQIFPFPTSSVQFYTVWKTLKTQEDKFKYLKRVKANKIPDIFKESLESNIFSNILDVLATYFIQEKEDVFDYMSNLTRVKRFSTLVMFLDSKDKNCLWKLITYLREQKVHSKNEIDELVTKYEL
ncbi:hypothetical protein GWI33_015334 [Rhynchophorus ferrugineus]|uniref:RNA polymerase II-associated protein 3 n=1 Tax=Rhynchophorus ferrugineus TaxID=354439 RepID=A0A834IDI9_RHYFE|nr:hypothetical protein GWI33_015334 [Rhynchophorus ferrugineus]